MANPASLQKGRKQPNKITRDMVELVREALEKRGGIKYLLQLDDEHFVKLLTRIVPNQIKAEIGAETLVVIKRAFAGRTKEGEQ